jgi:hypothetical protein
MKARWAPKCLKAKEEFTPWDPFYASDGSFKPSLPKKTEKKVSTLFLVICTV